MTWKVTLYNHHAACGIYATARTRREAFNRAYVKAGTEFRHYGLVPHHFACAADADVMWFAAFNGALAYMRPGATSATHDNRHGQVVEIRRTA